MQDVELAEAALQRYLGATNDAQRETTYPEIWSRLDAALAGARTEGKDTSRIDAIRSKLGDAAIHRPPPPNDSAIEAASQAFAWFRSQYAALHLGTASPIPVLGPSKLQKTLISGVGRVVIIICAIVAMIAIIAMRSR